MVGLILLSISLLIFLIKHFFTLTAVNENTLKFIEVFAFILAFLFLFPFELIPLVIFDNKEWEPNENAKQLVVKLRLRAVLFNNISVIIFFATVFVIVCGFYLLINPPNSNKNDNISNLTIRISASVLLIFLVQVLFRVFKYILRVAAFYNGKADAIEYHATQTDLPLEKLMDMFTPDKYDISDLQQTSASDNLIDIIKSKFGK